ncbi:MAG: DUF6522 family protein [Steroidobacteraceae bacterium]
MSTITLADGNIDLDAAVIAADLDLDCPGVLEALRARQLTAVCERGIDKDAGRYRVTFYHGNTRLRLIVDAGGQIVERSVARLHRIPQMRPMKRLRELSVGDEVSRQAEPVEQPCQAAARDDREV